MSTAHTKVVNKKLEKGEYTGTLLSSLSKADFTRFQHKISPCFKFKKFKTNKAVVTIVIGLENMSEPSKVCFR